jgi:hypothetical protein
MSEPTRAVPATATPEWVRRMYHRTLAQWAMDWLAFRATHRWSARLETKDSLGFEEFHAAMTKSTDDR